LAAAVAWLAFADWLAPNKETSTFDSIQNYQPLFDETMKPTVRQLEHALLSDTPVM